MDARTVGRKLVEMCRENKFLEAMDALYSPAIVSVETMGDETMPQTIEGLDAVRGKGQWWVDHHQVHRTEVKGPFPNGDQFAVVFTMDVTPKVGPKAGQRMTFDEVALYTVKDGRIVHEKFYYDMEG